MIHCSRFIAAACAWLLLGNLFVAGQEADPIEQEEQAIKAAAAKIAPSVVRIETVGGLEKVGKLLVAQGPSTGLIVSEDGFIVSSAFSFVQKPTSILVTLPGTPGKEPSGGSRAAATIVARDHARMLVLLKVNTTEKLPVPVAVPRNEMQVGQWTIAVGRTFDAGQISMSAGILSAKERIWSKAVQTDAKISPINYGGPLVDIQGRVIGVLAPLSPQGQGGELAGAEWYDSGIGFAVPLADIQQNLEQWKTGKDLHPGLIGISLKPGDIYALPAEIAAVPANSPAAKAGLKVGDKIVAIDGAPITRQAQLKHAFGPKYAGQRIKLSVVRREKEDEQKLDFEVELVDVLIPFEHPLLGVLPMRGASEKGITVRDVIPKSPAAELGLKAGDRIVTAAGLDVENAAAMQQYLSGLDPTTKLELTWIRAGKEENGSVQLGKLTAYVPGKLPPAVMPNLPAAAEKPATGVVEIKLPEEKNLCLALVPENYHPQVSHGVLVYLPPPGAVDKEKLQARWQALAEQNQVIVLSPQSADPKKWDPTETAFIRKALDDLISHYNVDTTRVAIFGADASGTMAFLTALEHRDRFLGLAAAEATLPARMKLPETDPVHRLEFFLASAQKSPVKATNDSLNTRLKAAKFPVTVHDLGETVRGFASDDDKLLFRWLDTLDRF